MIEQRRNSVKDGGRLIDRRRNFLAGTVIVIALIGNDARAQSIKLRVDSSFAEYLLALVCSGDEVNEKYLRELPALQSQIKHHSNHSPSRNFNAFMEGLGAAAKCETLDDDLFRFAPVVEEKEVFEETVAYFKSRAGEIEDFVVDSLSVYVPADLDYEGALVLSIVGNSCGGFSMDGKFFLALNCLRDSYVAEFQTAKLIAAHETYHALQYEFFYPFEEDIGRVTTLDDAFDYHFTNLMGEGTAEFVADSRQLTGSGALTDLLKDLARKAYGRIQFYFRLFNYTAEFLKEDDLTQRLNDVYQLGYSGNGGQVFYFVGAEMARHIEEVFGREQLICILKLPAEQFVRAYRASAMADDAPLLGSAIGEAADRLSNKRERHLWFERCVN